MRPALLVAAGLLATPTLAAAPNAPGYLPSTPDLGIAAGQCRPRETGPAVIVVPTGLKDRKGKLRVEVYPANDEDFLADDNVLVMAGKTFRRAEIPLPAQGPVEVCIRLPAPGAFSIIVLHDRDSNRKFGLSSDGVGFPGDPRLGLAKPRSAAAQFDAGRGVGRVEVRMNYRRGLFGFGPLKG